MGPACEVTLAEFPSEQALGRIDAVLTERSEQVNRTRKGLVWDIWIRKRPVHVAVVDLPPRVELSADCNSPEDYEVLRSLGAELASNLDGSASEPTK